LQYGVYVGVLHPVLHDESVDDTFQVLLLEEPVRGLHGRVFRGVHRGDVRSHMVN
jgi:hypothetical protein